MNVDQLTTPVPLTQIVAPLGRLSVDDARELLDSAAEAIDVEAISETVSDAGAVAADLLADVVTATGTASLAGGRLARTWVVRTGRVVARRPTPFVAATVVIAVVLAVALWKRSGTPSEESGETTPPAA